MGPGLIPKPVAIAIAVIITAVWAASQLGSLFVAGYEAPEGIHAALMIVLGAVFALRRSDAADSSDKNERRRARPARADDPDDPDDGAVDADPCDEPDDAAWAAAQTLVRRHPEAAADLIARLQRERRGGDR